MAHPTSLPPTLIAANDNAEASRALPDVVLRSLVDLLAEVGSARLSAANDNAAPSCIKDRAE